MLLHAGLMVTERNWLDVYPYSNWGGGQGQLPPMQPGQTFVPNDLLLRQVGEGGCMGLVRGGKQGQGLVFAYTPGRNTF